MSTATSRTAIIERIKCVSFLFIVWFTYTEGGIAFEPSDKTSARSAANEQFSDSNVAALATAAAIGDIKEIDQLVEKGVNVNAKSDKGTLTPLFFSIRWNCYLGEKANIAGFQRLLEHGANADYHVVLHELPTLESRENAYSSGPECRSVIFCAASIHRLLDSGKIECDSEWLKLLLKYGANPNQVYPGGSDKYTVDICAGWTPIFNAIGNGNMTGVDLLIQAGADINHQDNQGNSPLVYAAGWCNYEIVNKLLEAGADHRIKNNQGNDLAYMIIEGSTRGSGVDPKSEQGRQLAKALTFLEKKGVNIDKVRKNVAAIKKHGRKPVDSQKEKKLE
jgi:hypothetical protein